MASPLADETRAVESFKKASLMVLGLAMQTYREKLADQQEVLMHLADMIIDTYSAESVCCVLQANARPRSRLRSCRPMPRGCSSTTRRCASRRRRSRRSPRCSTATRCGRRSRHCAGCSGRCRSNTAVLRRRLADEAVARGGYIF